MLEGEMYRPYNFVYNIYKEFAPQHLQRIRDAITRFPTPPKRSGVSLSLTAAYLPVKEGTSELHSLPRDDVPTTIPSQPSGPFQEKDLALLREQLENQTQLVEERVRGRWRKWRCGRRETRGDSIPAPEAPYSVLFSLLGVMNYLES
jgi:hypothetical protein